MINLYFELLQSPVFTIEDVNTRYNNINSARSAVKSLMQKGLAVKIRNNLYTCISGETKEPLANRFQIACALTPTACLSHHTAAEYYGMAMEAENEVYVVSETSFNAFDFNGFHYRYVRPASDVEMGITTSEYDERIRVTDPERTILDCIQDMDKFSGPEEILPVLMNVPPLSENLLLNYLEEYHNQFLYQKIGYLLELIAAQGGQHFSDYFYDACSEKAGKSKRYLIKYLSDGVYNARWRLVVPKGAIF